MLSSTLYTKYPTVFYDNNIITDITVRLKFKDVVKNTLAVYYPYTIKEGERPDTLAYKYYDDPSYSWLIFLANDIYDPVYDWPLSNDMFNEMIKDKYGSIENAQEEIVFYRVDWTSDDSMITTAAYESLPAKNKKYWAPVIGTNNKVTSYERAVVDWALETNKIVQLSITQTNNAASIAVGDKLYQLTSGSRTAEAVVEAINAAGIISVKHVTGEFAAGAKTTYVNNVVYGNCTSATVVSTNLDPVEENYWVAVNAYDYETELNESKKHIQLIDKIYIDAIERDIRNLLA